MSGQKTIDGIRIPDIIKLLGELEAVSVRSGTNHPYIAESANIRPCPIATSTHAKQMLVPWIEKTTGYDRKKIYQSLQRGKWYI